MEQFVSLMRVRFTEELIYQFCEEVGHNELRGVLIQAFAAADMIP